MKPFEIGAFKIQKIDKKKTVIGNNKNLVQIILNSLKKIVCKTS